MTNDQLWYLYTEILNRVDENISETGRFIVDYFDDNGVSIVDEERNTYNVLFALFFHHATLSKMDLISTNGVFCLNIEAMERIAKKKENKMKKLEEIFKQEPMYLHNWEEDKKIGVISDFENIYITKVEFEAADCPIGSKEYWLNEKSKMQQKLKEWEGINILFASYGQDNYSGDAFVLFEKDGKLYEVNGSHCSCYGLEGQFEPEETTLEAIRYRLVEGTMGRDYYSDNEFADELMLFLGI